MEKSLAAYESDLNLGAKELRLGLPGSEHPNKQSCFSEVKRNKRTFSDVSEEVKENSSSQSNSGSCKERIAPPAKGQVVGWPPIRSYRKNTLQQSKDPQNNDGAGMFVKVSMDGAPYLRKIGLEAYKNYPELLEALQSMFKCTFGEYSEREGYNGSEYAPTYEDKDGDWMLVGDVPWDMFISSCKRLRIMRASEAKGLGCL